MVLNERFLGLGDGLLDGMELLCDVETGPAGLDHLDDAFEMPAGPLQPLDNFGMGFVDVNLLNHSLMLSLWKGYDKHR